MQLHVVWFAALVAVACADSSSLFELHPSFDECSEQCEIAYPMKEQPEECKGCCNGCRFSAMTGVSSVDGKIEDHKDKCYSGCLEAFEGSAAALEACKVGCDSECKIGITKLNEMVKTFSSEEMLAPFKSFMPSSFGMPDLPPGISDLINGMIDSFPQMQSAGEKGRIPKIHVQLIPMERMETRPLLGADGHDAKYFASQQYGDHHDSHRSNSGFDLRGLDDDEDHHHHHHDHHNDSRGHQEWSERQTVHLLLIVSLISCLLAIAFLVCNSGRNPIVRVNRLSAITGIHGVVGVDPRLPPTYETLYGDKKYPGMLVVAGTDVDAPPLPDKADLASHI